MFTVKCDISLLCCKIAAFHKKAQTPLWNWAGAANVGAPSSARLRILRAQQKGICASARYFRDEGVKNLNRGKIYPP